MEEAIEQAPLVVGGQGGEKMLAPQEVQRMLALSAQGWGAKRISRELGCSRNTVREYLRQGGWRPMDVSGRGSALEPHKQWRAERLRRHKGNADVVRQDLARELGVEVSLRTVQRAVEPLRRELSAQAVATVRYETAPGQQLQIDFGSTTVPIGDEVIRVHLFVATLGFSRRGYVAVCLHERQSAWMHGLEGAFRHFGGVPRKALVTQGDPHDLETRAATAVRLHDHDAELLARADAVLVLSGRRCTLVAAEAVGLVVLGWLHALGRIPAVQNRAVAAQLLGVERRDAGRRIGRLELHRADAKSDAAEPGTGRRGRVVAMFFAVGRRTG
jgi:transposase